MPDSGTQPEKLPDFTVPDIIKDDYWLTALPKLRPLIDGGVRIITRLRTCEGTPGSPKAGSTVEVTCPAKGATVQSGDELDIGVSVLS